MARKTYLPEQIINKLREAEIHLSQGATIAEASRKIGVTEQTYYRWRREYGGMRIEQAKLRRGVAQPGSAPEWGSGGRRFKSGHPDHQFTPKIPPKLQLYSDSSIKPP